MIKKSLVAILLLSILSAGCSGIGQQGRSYGVGEESVRVKPTRAYRNFNDQRRTLEVKNGETVTNYEYNPHTGALETIYIEENNRTYMFSYKNPSDSLAMREGERDFNKYRDIEQRNASNKESQKNSLKRYKLRSKRFGNPK